jgi:putative colanic acid polymerase
MHWPTVFIAVGIVFQHFTVFEVLGFQVTLGLLIGVPALFLLVGAEGVPRLVRLILPAVFYLSFVALVEAEFVEPSQFVSSLALIVLALVILSLSQSGFRITNINFLTKSLGVVFVALSLFSFAQTVTGFFGSDFLFNPWREFQYQYLYQPFVGNVTFPRAAGAFLEPSYNAFVIGSLAVCLILLGKPISRVLPVALIGIGSTQSANGLLIFGLLVFFLLVFTKSKRKAMYFLVLTTLLVVFQSYLTQRITSLDSLGSSANYRFFAPLQMIADILLNHPFGLPAGSIDSVVPRYGLVMFGKEVTSSIDNGFYVIVYLSGWIGVVAISLLLFLLLRRILAARLRNPNSWISTYWLTASLLFSGGIYNPEYALICGLVLACAKSKDFHPPESKLVDFSQSANPYKRSPASPRPGTM